MIEGPINPGGYDTPHWLPAAFVWDDLNPRRRRTAVTAAAPSSEGKAPEPAAVPSADVVPAGAVEEPAESAVRRRQAPVSGLSPKDAHGRRRSRTAAASGSAAASDLSSEPAGAQDSKREFPSSRAEPESKPARTRAGDAFGANQSPFLD